MKKIIIALTMVLAFAGASFAADAATPADGGAAVEKKADKKAESKVKKAKKAKKAKAEAAAAVEKKAE